MRENYKLPILITLLGLFTLGFKIQTLQYMFWTAPQKIEGVWDSGHLSFEILPDQEGYVHLIWEQVENGNRSLDYSRWDGTVWSLPNDIILSPIGGNATILSAVIGNDSNIYIVFFGGDQDTGKYFLSRSRSSDAGSAQSWSMPEELADSSGGGASLIFDQEDKLHFFYVDVEDEIETSIQHIYSEDWGVTWSFPEAVFIEPSEMNLPEIITAIDESGRIHMTWATFDEQAFGQFVYYTHWQPESSQWSPVRIVGQKDPGDFGVGYPFLVAIGTDIVHLTWQDGLVPPRRYANWSQDGGNTWTQPVEVFGVVGQNGRVGPMVVDSAGQLHAITHGRYGNPATHGIFYIPWIERYWGPRTPIAEKPIDEGEPQDRFDPQNPKLVVYSGNRLMAVYGNDPHRGLWFSTAETDAPYIEPKPFPTVTPMPTLTPSPEPIGTVTEIAAAPDQGEFLSNMEISSARPLNNWYPLLLGGWSAFLISMSVVIIRRIRRKN